MVATHFCPNSRECVQEIAGTGLRRPGTGAIGLPDQVGQPLHRRPACAAAHIQIDLHVTKLRQRPAMLDPHDMARLRPLQHGMHGKVGADP